MQKSELIRQIADSMNMSLACAENFLETICNICQEALVKGDSVPLPGLGKLISKTSKARQGRHPKTGEVINISSRKVVAFKASREFKTKLVNENVHS